MSIRRNWDVFDANRDAPWAEQVAWTAARIDLPRDECVGDCLLRVAVLQPMQYWKRLPAGAHVREALSLGADMMEAADDAECPSRESAQSFRNSVREIRGSLVAVQDSGKRRIVDALDRLERKCQP